MSLTAERRKPRTIKKDASKKLDRHCRILLAKGWASCHETEVLQTLAEQAGQPKRADWIFSMVLKKTTKEEFERNRQMVAPAQQSAPTMAMAA